jgi:hypothetical protein
LPQFATGYWVTHDLAAVAYFNDRINKIRMMRQCREQIAGEKTLARQTSEL